tara:strand:+ start:1432 stop:1731 length:300 start_codon:yes stop_codon:yes gene_type:complete
MHPDDKTISDSALNMLKFLLNTDNLNKCIVLVGNGATGKSYIINECKELITSKNYKIHDGYDRIKLNYFEDKYVISILHINEIQEIDTNKYLLINLNKN